jgi:hypothetical protein
MKISIDGILGTARKINNQKEREDNNLDRKKSGVKVDSVSIGSRLNNRLDSIETEFREIQSSLTRNQIIRDGIEQLRNDLGRDGGKNQPNILKKVTFEGTNVLHSFVGDDITEPILKTKQEKNTELINSDVNHLKKLQVELDNMTASDLVGSERLKKIVSNIDSIFSRSVITNIENISSIRADAVMRLIK